MSWKREGVSCHLAPTDVVVLAARDDDNDITEMRELVRDELSP